MTTKLATFRFTDNTEEPKYQQFNTAYQAALQNTTLKEYNWVYRFRYTREYNWDAPNLELKPSEVLRCDKPDQNNKHLMNILNGHHCIVIYDSGCQKLQGREHFHIISFHHTFKELKKGLMEAGDHESIATYMKAERSKTPYGYASYLSQENAGKQLIFINNITTEAQKMLFDIINDNHHIITRRPQTSGLKNIDTVRAKKYKFIKQIFEHCAGRDISDLVHTKERGANTKGIFNISLKIPSR